MNLESKLELFAMFFNQLQSTGNCLQIVWLNHAFAQILFCICLVALLPFFHAFSVSR